MELCWCFLQPWALSDYLRSSFVQLLWSWLMRQWCFLLPSRSFGELPWWILRL